MSTSSTLALRHAQALARLGLGLGLLATSCAQGKGDQPVESVTPLAAASPSANPGDLDVLFMIDDSSSMTTMQQKLASQIPGFVTALQTLPLGLPNIHIAVVSSDMGAPGDLTASIQCTQSGDRGIFQNGLISGHANLGLGGASGAFDGGDGGGFVLDGGSFALDGGGLALDGGGFAIDGGSFALDGGGFGHDGGGFGRDGGGFGHDGGVLALDGGGGNTGAGIPGCTGVSLNAGATFISNIGGVANYTGDLSTLLSCMTQLGEQGCGFENQIGSVARALGADGTPAPAQNAGFLRPGAALAVIFLTNEDDCSAPSNTTLYSLNGFQQNLSDPLGPVANYRCNSFGHLCVDPAAGGSACLLEPPLAVPTDAQGTVSADAQGIASEPTLNLTDCESNDSDGLLTTVSSFVKGIKALKADPDNQIVVGAITAPATPYTVAWVPEAGGQNTNPGELWPQVEHSCGPAGGDDVNPAGQTTTDGSFGDPAVRITQLVGAFGRNGVTSSICDQSYGTAFSAIVNRIGAQLQGGSAGSSTGTAGAAGTALAICANGINPGINNGLKSGGCGDGCAVGASHPGAFTLALLGIVLGVARRRRKSVR